MTRREFAFQHTLRKRTFVKHFYSNSSSKSSSRVLSEFCDFRGSRLFFQHWVYNWVPLIGCSLVWDSTVNSPIKLGKCNVISKSKTLCKVQPINAQFQVILRKIFHFFSFWTILWVTVIKQRTSIFSTSEWAFFIRECKT